MNEANLKMLCTVGFQGRTTEMEADQWLPRFWEGCGWIGKAQSIFRAVKPFCMILSWWTYNIMCLLKLVEHFSTKSESIKGMRAPWRSNWLQGWSRENIKGAWNISWCWKTKCLKKMDTCWKHANQSQGATNGQSWNHLSNKIKIDNMAFNS